MAIVDPRVYQKLEKSYIRLYEAENIIRDISGRNSVRKIPRGSGFFPSGNNLKTGQNSNRNSGQGSRLGSEFHIMGRAS